MASENSQTSLCVPYGLPSCNIRKAQGFTGFRHFPVIEPSIIGCRLCNNILKFYGEPRSLVKTCISLQLEMQMRFCCVSRIPTPGNRLATPHLAANRYPYAIWLQVRQQGIFFFGMPEQDIISPHIPCFTGDIPVRGNIAVRVSLPDFKHCPVSRG